MSPIINTAYKGQKNIGKDILKRVLMNDLGTWNCFLFVDGKTRDFHIEKDCAYTFITVPDQVMRTNRNPDEYPTFRFKLNKSTEVMLPMKCNVSFLYNANFLTHRQEYTIDRDKDGYRFYNISTYANQKLFSHLRHSFKRMAKN